MKLTPFYLFVWLIIFPFLSRASAYWMDVKGSGKLNEPVSIKLYYGNIDESGTRKPLAGPELMLTGEFKLFVVDAKGKRMNIPIALQGDCWEGTFTPHEKGLYRVLGINDSHPVVDRSKTGGENVLPIDYLCADYRVEFPDGLESPLQFLDIITVQKNQSIVVHAYNNQIKAVKGTKIRVFNPENWEKELLIDENGEAVFQPTMKGLYIIREDWTSSATGTYKGVSYTKIRHRCNYFKLVQ